MKMGLDATTGQMNEQCTHQHLGHRHYVTSHRRAVLQPSEEHGNEYDHSTQE